MSAINYHETVWSGLFAGNRTTVTCLKPAVLGAETGLDLALEQRKRTVYRLDGGAGTDETLQWLVGRGYHFIAKGFSGKRAYALAQQVSRWDAYDATSWLGTVQSPVDFWPPGSDDGQKATSEKRVETQLLCLDPGFFVQKSFYGSLQSQRRG